MSPSLQKRSCVSFVAKETLYLLRCKRDLVSPSLQKRSCVSFVAKETLCLLHCNISEVVKATEFQNEK